MHFIIRQRRLLAALAGRQQFFFFKKSGQTHKHTNPDREKTSSVSAHPRGSRRGPGSPRSLSSSSKPLDAWPILACDEAAQVHRPRLAKPVHSQPLLHPDRRCHYCAAVQRNGRPCLGAVLSPVFPHFGGGGGGVILLHACSYVYNT